jgi:hypothetical protein
MLHQFSSKFELSHSELDIVKEYLSVREAAMIHQARKPIPQGLQTDLNPISDNKEEGRSDVFGGASISGGRPSKDARAENQGSGLNKRAW